ncbi:MAG: hypothetical protein HKO63_03150 [Acidimicrobiia bacterium]|nr:hypothetical protein [Acidimicrobiia bacterium]MBT8193180.1 hypothetical protein [Acidimicrobiia bacterium]MBT8247128.1 hypothetical protein [Acidimicrobiia bacterium]NNF87972.1 hypothetical protein [Acidimicrobiia bacterium]NNJ48266.1 hypothetical protein [Acidimicrobiia bacterium]
MKEAEFVTVGMFAGRPEAEVSRARLESEGVEALVRCDDAGGYEPQLGLTNGVRLMVRARYVATALGILEPVDAVGIHRSRPWVTSVAALLAGILVLLMSMPALVTLARAMP